MGRNGTERIESIRIGLVQYGLVRFDLGFSFSFTGAICSYIMRIKGGYHETEFGV